jgi:hypothetical protein
MAAAVLPSSAMTPPAAGPATPPARHDPSFAALVKSADDTKPSPVRAPDPRRDPPKLPSAHAAVVRETVATVAELPPAPQAATGGATPSVEPRPTPAAVPAPVPADPPPLPSALVMAAAAIPAGPAQPASAAPDASAAPGIDAPAAPAPGPDAAATDADQPPAPPPLAALLPAPVKGRVDDKSGAADPAVPGGAGAAAGAGQAATAASFPGLAATASGDVAEAGTRAASPSIPAPPEAPASPAAQVVTLLRGAAAESGQTFTMQLKPERLGTVEVRLEIDAKGHAAATFLADRPETLQLLKHDAPELVRALKEAGVEADAGTLGFGLRDTGAGGSNASDRQTGAGRLWRGESASAGGTADDPITRKPAVSNRLYDLHA